MDCKSKVARSASSCSTFFSMSPVKSIEKSPNDSRPTIDSLLGLLFRDFELTARTVADIGDKILNFTPPPKSITVPDLKLENLTSAVR